ncbi:MAG: hypothetical protein SFY32_10520 [Bacteroidota bacterium]|nr:hypothetical protein [Bacteroidota bacterium]
MVTLFIHPNLRNPQHKQHKSAIILSWVLLFILLFIVFYLLYFEIYESDNKLKMTTNYVQSIIFIASIIAIRFSKNLSNTIAVAALCCYPIIFICIYTTGGIFSVDVIWMIIITTLIFVFSGTRWGLGFSIISILIIVILFKLEEGGYGSNNYFKKYIIEHNSNYYFLTLFFVFILMSAVLTVFTNILQKANQKIELLTQEKIETLEKMVAHKTLELSDLRRNLSKDFHDEMGNKLASINIISETIGIKLLSKDSDKTEISEMLGSIKNKTKELIEGTRDFIWSVDFKSDYIIELYKYMRDFGNTFFRPFNIDFMIEEDFEENIEVQLAPTITRQIVFICKEILTNAAKHALCTQVQVLMQIQTNYLVISISDNGKGFDVKIKSERGLRNIIERIKLINGTYTVDSNANGTKYELSIPIKS